MCQEQSLIHPLCHHFTTRRLTRCYPRGRSSQCTGKSIVSQHWASTQLCSSCRAVGHPSGEATTNPLLPPWATLPYHYPWYSYGALWGYPVIGGESESGRGGNNVGLPPPYTPSNTGATVGVGATAPAAPIPAAPTPAAPTTTPAQPPPPPAAAITSWARLMSHTPTPPLPPTPAPPRQHPWGQYFARTSAPPAPPTGNPWNSYQAPQAQPSAWASLTAAPAASGNRGGWGGLMGTSVAPPAPTTSRGNPWAVFTEGNGNAVPSAPVAHTARGFGPSALSTGSGGSGSAAMDGAEAKDLGGRSPAGWAELMVRSCRASQE